MCRVKVEMWDVCKECGRWYGIRKLSCVSLGGCNFEMGNGKWLEAPRYIEKCGNEPVTPNLFVCLWHWYNRAKVTKWLGNMNQGQIWRTPCVWKLLDFHSYNKYGGEGTKEGRFTLIHILKLHSKRLGDPWVWWSLYSGLWWRWLEVPRKITW